MMMMMMMIMMPILCLQGCSLLLFVLTFVDLLYSNSNKTTGLNDFTAFYVGGSVRAATFVRIIQTFFQIRPFKIAIQLFLSNDEVNTTYLKICGNIMSINEVNYR